MKNTKISENVYEKLADALEALPSGFTRTPGKIGNKLIKIVFHHEEAWLAGQLTRKLETADEIAERVGLHEEKVTVLLESMVPRRKVRKDSLALESGIKGVGKVEANPGQQARRWKKYRLSPFIVGWFESYLNNPQPESEEFARLSSNMSSRAGANKSSHRDPARRVSSLTVARSSPSGSSGNRTMMSMLISRDMIASWFLTVSARKTRLPLTATVAICPSSVAASWACLPRSLSRKTSSPARRR